MPIPLRMLWKCAWKHGKGEFVSFVLARTQQEALELLGEFGGPGDVDASVVEVVDYKARFIVSFRACYEDHDVPDAVVHWHATDDISEDLDQVLGEPPEREPPPEPEEPKCQKCGQVRFAPVHHPDYDRANKCQYEPPPAEPAPEPAQVAQTEVGPDRPTSE